MQLISFSDALVALKAGQRVARMGWNGKGMFVYRVPAASYPAQTAVAKMVFGEVVPYRAYFAIHGADGLVATWVPSSTDLDAEDWFVILHDEQLTLLLEPDDASPVLGVFERLRTERLELEQRYQKLVAFLPTPNFRSLPSAQRELMATQVGLMRQYCSVLTRREQLLEQEVGGR